MNQYPPPDPPYTPSGGHPHQPPPSPNSMHPAGQYPGQRMAYSMEPPASPNSMHPSGQYSAQPMAYSIEPPTQGLPQFPPQSVYPMQQLQSPVNLQSSPMGLQPSSSPRMLPTGVSPLMHSTVADGMMMPNGVDKPTSHSPGVVPPLPQPMPQSNAPSVFIQPPPASPTMQSPSTSPYSYPTDGSISSGSSGRLPAGYLGKPKMSITTHTNIVASPTLQPSARDHGSPITVQVSRSTVDGQMPSNVGYDKHIVKKGSMLKAGEREALLPLAKGKGDEKERQTARLIFVWLGVSTLVLQTTMFLTMEDVQNKFFPSMRYSFYAHNIFACSFFVGTAAFACFPARLLFSLRLLSSLNFIGIFLGLTFRFVLLVGAGRQWAFITALVCVGCITFLSVLLIPVVFTSASAVPGECAMYAASGQGLGAVVTALSAVILVACFGPQQFLFAVTILAVIVHGVAVISVRRLRSFPWASRRLQRLSDAHTPSAVEDGRRASNAVRSRRKRISSSCFGIMKLVIPQLVCAFMSTFVSFALFPAFSTALGHNVSRGFGVAMVAIFHGSDQIGRHVPEFGLGLAPFVLLFMVIARLGFLPLYAAMFAASAQATSLLASVWVKSLVEAALGFTHGWAVASSFRYIPAGLTKYEMERVQFYLSLSNALGIPCGALLMSGLVYSGIFPRI